MTISKKLYLDGKELSTKNDLIAFIYKEVGAIEAGMNYDALWDVLTDDDYVNPDTSAIIVTNVEDILSAESEKERDAFFELLEDLEDEGGWAVAIEENF